MAYGPRWGILSPIFSRLVRADSLPSIRQLQIGMGLLIVIGPVVLYPVAVRKALTEAPLRPPVPILGIFVQIWLMGSLLLPLISAALAGWLTAQHLNDPGFDVERLIPDLTPRQLVRTYFAAAVFRLRVPLGIYVATIPTVSIVMVIDNISSPTMRLLNPTWHVFRNTVLYGGLLLWPAAMSFCAVSLGILFAILTRHVVTAGGSSWLILVLLPLVCTVLPSMWLGATSTLENDMPTVPTFSFLGGTALLYLLPFVLTPLLLHGAILTLRTKL